MSEASFVCSANPRKENSMVLRGIDVLLHMNTGEELT